MNLNWTPDEIDAIQKAIKTGTTQVRFSDGRLVTYRSLSEMKDLISDATASGSASKPRRTAYVQHSRG